jgi:hypothetical protein
MDDLRTWTVAGDVLTLHLEREIGDRRAKISFALVDLPEDVVPPSKVPANAARGIIEKMDQFERDAKKMTQGI